ncbi:MAG: ATP phosphoribosyltransferase [Acidimicrobiales bacterium]
MLEDAGLAPEEPGAQVLAVHCRSAPVDVLFVRAADVPEYVQDGVVDCGITGLDLVHERGSDVEVLLYLGFGACSLQAAVPAEDGANMIADLSGRRIATSFPRLATAALSAEGVTATMVQVAGSVEIAPRLGLADAVVDLVSSGSTMRTNGLRPIGELFLSEAVLIGRRDASRAGDCRSLSTMLGSVIQARASRYLMCNAPLSVVDEIARMLPTRGAPSVIPLTAPDTVALHALVPAAGVWDLLPSLELLGATSILILPVERLLA